MIQIEEEYLDFIKSDDYFSSTDHFLQYTFQELVFDHYVKININNRTHYEDRVVLSLFLKCNNITLPIGKFVVDKDIQKGKFNQQFFVDDINLVLGDFSSIECVDYKTLIENVKDTFEYRSMMLSHKLRNEDIHYVV